MKLILSTLAMSIAFSAGANLPDNYQDLGAKQKRDIIWNNIEKSDYSLMNQEYPNASFLRYIGNLLDVNFLRVTFDRFSDEMPYTNDFITGEKKYRVKAIHQKGTTAKIRFKPNTISKLLYTGVFSKESIGLARISRAVPQSFNPGMGLKFFVDGKPSVNTAVMKSLSANSRNCDPFFDDFTNVIPRPSGFLAIAAYAFKAVAGEKGGTENELTLEHMAHEDGKKGVAPYQIILKPTKLAQGLPFSCKDDYRDLLRHIGAGDKIYNVYAKSSPKTAELKIGSIELDSSFIPSSYGDEVLFFQHRIDK